jgi:hypothetical protein
MAKASDIPGLDGSMPYGEAAARTVAVRASEVYAHAEGVLDMRDIERVHAMRVATRRLRAVLEIYEPCFPREELGPVLREVKTLADALGERRDPDVELLALEQFAASVGPDERAGVEVFIERTRAQQLAANAALAAALEEAERSGLRTRLEGLAQAARGRVHQPGLEVPQPGRPEPGPPVPDPPPDVVPEPLPEPVVEPEPPAVPEPEYAPAPQPEPEPGEPIAAEPSHRLGLVSGPQPVVVNQDTGP